MVTNKASRMIAALKKEWKREGPNRHLPIFSPEDGKDAAEGWMLHAARRRKIHELASRRYARYRVGFGVLATVLAAVAGNNAVQGWRAETTGGWRSTAAVLLGIGSVGLMSAVTFLDYGARAEGHRRSAADYKSILRDYEERLGDYRTPSDIATLKELLARVDAAAPVVPERLGTRIEKETPCWPKTVEALILCVTGECPDHVKSSVPEIGAG